MNSASNISRNIRIANLCNMGVCALLAITGAVMVLGVLMMLSVDARLAAIHP